MLVLGPRVGAPVEVAGPEVSIAEDLSRRLLESIGEPPDVTMSLRRAIQRCERVRGQHQCRSLMQQLIQDYEGCTTPMHKDLAELPFRLVLCTTQDNLMLHSLRSAGKAGAVAAHYDYDNRVEQSSLLTVPTVSRPIVYSLLGRHDHPGSMVLNDANLLDYLIRMSRESPRLPDAIRSTLRDPSTVFLFLGFGFDNWWPRLLLKVLEVTGVANRGVSLALEQARAAEESSLEENTEFFVASGIYIRAGDCGELARQLRTRINPDRIRAAMQASTQRPPKVFLSYASEDAEIVGAIRDGLQVRGLDVWLDRTNLRAGQDWASEIHRVIGGVHFFVFIQTEQMDRRDRDGDRMGGVYNQELQHALSLMSRKLPGTPFIFHLTVGACAPRPEEALGRLHRVRLEDGGVEGIAQAMLESFGRAAT